MNGRTFLLLACAVALVLVAIGLSYMAGGTCVPIEGR
jgi:hypothetical protein